MLNTFSIKQNNIVILQYTTEESLGGNDIKSAIRDVNNYSKVLVITDIEDKAFKVTLDTVGLAVGPAEMDIKIGNVSSETIIVDIQRGVA